MSALDTFLNTLPGHWAIIALIAGIGLSVVFLRSLIRIAVRVLVIGTVGFILLTVVYFILNYLNISL